MSARNSGPAGRELRITRVFDAPRDLVFQAWTEPERLMRWWGPKGFTTSSFEMDLRPGGGWRAVMRTPEGEEHVHYGVVREVVRPERLVFTFTWEDEPDHEMLVTVTFTERGGKTEMALHQAPFASAESRDSHQEGWNETFDRLAEYLAQD